MPEKKGGASGGRGAGVRVCMRAHICTPCECACGHVWVPVPGGRPAGPAQPSEVSPQSTNTCLPTSAQRSRGVSHADLISHPDCHWGLQDSGFLVEILPCIFWEGVSERGWRRLEEAVKLTRGLSYARSAPRVLTAAGT